MNTTTFMLLQLESHFDNLADFSYPISDFYDAVMTIKSRLEPKYQDIFEVLAIAIFETTLVRELVEFFEPLY